MPELAHQKIDVISRHRFCMWVSFYICRLSQLLLTCLHLRCPKDVLVIFFLVKMYYSFLIYTQICVRQLFVWVNQRFVLPCSQALWNMPELLAGYIFHFIYILGVLSWRDTRKIEGRRECYEIE